MMECLPLGSIQVRKPTTLGKAYGIMCGVIGNLGNPLGICWKHIGNKKIVKKSLHSPPQPARKRNWAFLSLCEPSHWLQEIFISKVICHHFSPKLMESMEVLWVYICDSCYSNTFPSLALKCPKNILFFEIHFNNKQ